MGDRFSHRQIVRKPAVESAGGIVAAQSRVAAEAGAAVLARGGNAVDAAVATGMTVGVAEPWMSGIGGGGVMVVYLAAEDRVQVIDFGMRAPAGLDPADYPLAGGADDDLFGWPGVVEQRNLLGGTAIAVPGHVDGLGLALERFGTMAWDELLAPAVALAEGGLPVDWFCLHQISDNARDLARFETSRDTYLPGGLPPGPLSAPTVLANPALAMTLRRLAETGPREMYEGELARAIVDDVQAAGGRLARDDLAGYRAELVEPLTLERNGARLSVLPTLNGGPTLARALEAAQGYATDGVPGGDFYLAIAEALVEAFRYRLSTLGDSDEAAAPSCTTHLSVVDRTGNLVALTQTLLSVFGSKVTLPGSGILMNNGINWFDPRPGRPNSLGPGKRPLCNYTPLVGRRDGRSFAIGASGGRKIIPAMTQMAAFLGEFGLSLEAALHQPRLNTSLVETVVAPPDLGPETLAALAARFDLHTAPRGVAPNSYAIASCVLREDGRNFGAVDPFHPWAEAVAEAGN